uniref:Peroxygenase 4 n=1 Tax=Ananas comosus var. bracteatus TaxID=296719 RepID=A0A6V7P7G0_ANACO|nr:unnamed protein product [Ananas comosus var. bracteatus]
MASSSSDVGSEGEMTPLQKHVAFFDRNKDGLVYPWETYQGFRAIGCGVALSSASALLINGFLGPKTRLGTCPSPLLPIYVKNIQKGKHGIRGDLKKHAHTNPNALTSKELNEMLKGNRIPRDHSGWVAAWTEWKILYLLCKDKDGLLQKETIRAVYDGGLFVKMEQERASSKKKP